MDHRFDQMIDRRGTYCTQWDFTIDRFGKEDILPFSISDMDFQSPFEIIQAIKNHAEHGIFGYTRWNHRSFKDAITNWYAKRFSAEMLNDWIVYSPSVIYTVSKLIELLTDVGDAIVLQTPAYDAFLNQMKASKRVLLENPLLYRDGYYELDMEDLELKLSQENTKVLLLCNPHNPTGRVWNERELTDIVKLCEQYDVKIISDDIHMDITHGNHVYTPIISMTENPKSVFICTSASKTFNTPSLGGSYAFIPDEKVRDTFMEIMKYRDGVSSATIFGVLSVIEGYNRASYWVDELRDYIFQNMQFMKRFIDKEIPALQFNIPESTYLAWIDCDRLHVTSEQLQDALVHTGGVGILSGDVYGIKAGTFLRMNVGCPQEKLKEGLKQLKKAVEAV